MRWLSTRAFHPARRVVATLCLVPALAAWSAVHVAQEGWTEPALVATLVGCAIALHLDDLRAQIAVRAFLSLTVLVGLLHLGDRPWGVASAAIALSALGGAGLVARGEPGPHRARLLLATTIALIQIALLVLLAHLHAIHGHPRRVVLDLACAAGPALGILGLARLRTWGVVAMPFASLVLTALVALERTRVAGIVLLPLGEAIDVYDARFTVAWIAGVFVQTVALAPLLAALVRQTHRSRIFRQ